MREKLKEVLTARQASFALSPDTGNRRKWVLGGYLVLLAAFGILAGVYLSREFSQQDTDYWLIGRQIGATLEFVVTAGFFLRWMNAWAQQHADEEFKLKQLEIDIDRASWVVEMAFEWQAEKDEDIPAELIDRLSANLFGSPTSLSHVSMTAGDAIASALMDTAAHAKLKLPGGEIDLDKKALRKLLKESDRTNG